PFNPQNRNFQQHRFQPRQNMIGGGFGFNRRPNPNNRNTFMGRPVQKAVFNPIPDGEFDFEKAQNELKILEEKMAGMKVNGTSEDGADDSGSQDGGGSQPDISTTTITTEDKEPCYNKSKSFFDKISCEALEREKG